MKKLQIRVAHPRDIQLIYKLVKELVIHQNLLHHFTATQEMLNNALFGKEKCVKAIIGYYETEPVAYALYFYNFSTFSGKLGLYLEDLYVKPLFRQYGFGQALLAYLAAEADKRDCNQLELRVIDSNTSAIQFYEHRGGTSAKEWITYAFDRKALRKLVKSS